MAEEEFRRNNPAEFPEGSEGGGGTGIPHRPGGEIAEYPAVSRFAGYEAVISEIVRVRARVASLEEQMLTRGMSGASRFQPNEYPEGEGAGTGGGGVFGGHIPRPEIHEYPIDLLTSLVERLSAIESQIASVAERLGQIEERG